MGNIGIALGGGIAIRMPVAAVIAIIILAVYGAIKFKEDIKG